MKIIFPTEEFERRCREQTLIGNDFLSEAFDFWLQDNDQLRSPFGAYIHEPLIQNTFERLMHWSFAQSIDTVDEALLSEVFQAIITDEGSKLVATDDERLSIVYPNFPRIGDTTTVADKGSYTVSRRQLLPREDKLFLQIYLMHLITKDLLATEFDVTNA